MTLELIEATPKPTDSRYWVPFDDLSGFTSEWWNKSQRLTERGSTYLKAIEGSAEVARLQLDDDLYLDNWRLDDVELEGPVLRIQYLEVRLPDRGRGVGTSAVGLLEARYPDRHLMALSENDAFWDSLGWSRHTHIDDPDDGRGRFQALYVNH